MTLSDLEWLPRKIFNDTKRRAVSLQQLSFFFRVRQSVFTMTPILLCGKCVTRHYKRTDYVNDGDKLFVDANGVLNVSCVPCDIFSTRLFVRNKNIFMAIISFYRPGEFVILFIYFGHFQTRGTHIAYRDCEVVFGCKQVLEKVTSLSDGGWSRRLQRWRAVTWWLRVWSSWCSKRSYDSLMSRCTSWPSSDRISASYVRKPHSDIDVCYSCYNICF